MEQKKFISLNRSGERKKKTLHDYFYPSSGDIILIQMQAFANSSACFKAAEIVNR